MTHEPRCIHIPCTCITILRDKVESLLGTLKASNENALTALALLDLKNSEIENLNILVRDLRNKLHDLRVTKNVENT